MFDENKYRKKRYWENPEKKRKYQEEWRKNNPEKIKAIAKRAYRKKISLNKNWNKEWYAKHAELSRKRCREANRERRRKILLHYSNNTLTCKLCNFSDVRALCLDHINNNGAEERRRSKKPTGNSFYSYLIKQGFPEGYQVLCANCNMIKEDERVKAKLNE